MASGRVLSDPVQSETIWGHSGGTTMRGVGMTNAAVRKAKEADVGNHQVHQTDRLKWQSNGCCGFAEVRFLSPATAGVDYAGSNSGLGRRGRYGRCQSCSLCALHPTPITPAPPVDNVVQPAPSKMPARCKDRLLGAAVRLSSCRIASGPSLVVICLAGLSGAGKCVWCAIV